MSGRDRYVSVVLRQGGMEFPAAAVFVQWSVESGRRTAEPFLGPVAVAREDSAAMTEARIVWILEEHGYRLAGPWNDTDDGFVAWIEPTLSEASA